MAPRIFAEQLSWPKGLLGRLIARLMNRHNASMNAFVVRQLELKPSDRVLEIGFGGGVILGRLIEGAAFVCGVDRSGDMVERAGSRFSGAVSSGRADFKEANVEALPFTNESFGKACTVNTIYFWRSLEAGFREIHRVLRPGGRLVVGFLPKDRMDRLGYPSDIFTTREPGDVIAALGAAGFLSASVEWPEPATPWNAIVALR
jgi:ubiquinone/menaquinone biosynthesis C-methylase UbiE